MNAVDSLTQTNRIKNLQACQLWSQSVLANADGTSEDVQAFKCAV